MKFAPSWLHEEFKSGYKVGTEPAYTPDLADIRAAILINENLLEENNRNKLLLTNTLDAFAKEAATAKAQIENLAKWYGEDFGDIKHLRNRIKEIETLIPAIQEEIAALALLCKEVILTEEQYQGIESSWYSLAARLDMELLELHLENNKVSNIVIRTLKPFQLTNAGADAPTIIAGPWIVRVDYHNVSIRMDTSHLSYLGSEYDQMYSHPHASYITDIDDFASTCMGDARSSIDAALINCDVKAYLVTLHSWLTNFDSNDHWGSSCFSFPTLDDALATEAEYKAYLENPEGFRHSYTGNDRNEDQYEEEYEEEVESENESDDGYCDDVDEEWAAEQLDLLAMSDSPIPTFDNIPTETVTTAPLPARAPWPPPEATANYVTREELGF